MHFIVWDPKVYGEDNGANIPVGTEPNEAFDAEDAAKVWASVNLDDGPRERTVHVRAPGGELTIWAVRAEEKIVFRAKRKEG